MMQNNQSVKYLEQKIQSASLDQILVMLHEKLIFHLNNVIRYVESGDIKNRYHSNEKAKNIILYFIGILDFKKEKDLSEKLESIYILSLDLLLEVDLRNQCKPAQQVIDLFVPLKDAWKQVAQDKVKDENKKNNSATSNDGDKKTSISWNL